jgi:PTS system galactitol-specific IIB component
MKKVYLVCATGIATSTMLRVKIEDYLDDHGIEADIRQFRVAELNASRLDADVIISTTSIPDEIRERATVVDGIPLITGQGDKEVLQKVVDILNS